VKLGNGNGKKEKEKEKGAPTPAHAEAPSAPTFSGRNLRIYFPRSADYEGDVRTMQDVHKVLLTSNGGDRVTLYVPNGVGIVVLQSQHLVNCTAGLIDGLREVLGSERVTVE